MTRNTESAEVRTKYGAGAAALISAGIGCFVIGLMTSLVEASAGLGKALNWWNSVGPLSGKTLVGVTVWIVAWLGLWLAWRNKDRSLRMAFAVMIVLVVVGLLLTFPLIFDKFA
jgi:hypothetical protein